MLRVSSAREMLEHSELPIQKVCARVGYEDAAFFRNLFKRHTGMTPVQYRERFAQMTFERGDLSSGRAPA
jgi:transcriptional regulator GlxA family with amidase domain